MKTIAEQLDDQAKGMAKDYLRTEGQLLSLLMEMREKEDLCGIKLHGNL